MGRHNDVLKYNAQTGAYVGVEVLSRVLTGYCAINWASTECGRGASCKMHLSKGDREREC